MAFTQTRLDADFSKNSLSVPERLPLVWLNPAWRPINLLSMLYEKRPCVQVKVSILQLFWCLASTISSAWTTGTMVIMKRKKGKEQQRQIWVFFVFLAAESIIIMHPTESNNEHTVICGCSKTQAVRATSKLENDNDFSPLLLLASIPMRFKTTLTSWKSPILLPLGLLFDVASTITWHIVLQEGDARD